MKRFYCIPGVLLSLIATLCPSFRIRVFIYRIFGNKIHHSATIHSFVRFIIPRNIAIGANTTINSNCMIDSRSQVNIGSNTMVGRNVKIFTLTHDIHSADFKTLGLPVNIGNNVVIFPYVMIMPGVSIGDNAVIYPGSIVTKSIDNNEIFAGVPAKSVGMRKTDIDYSLNYKMYMGV